MLVHSYEKVFCLKFYRIHMPLQLVWVGHAMPQRNSISGHCCLGWRYWAQTNADLLFCSHFFLLSWRLHVAWSKTVLESLCRQTERLKWTLCADMSVWAFLVFLKKWYVQSVSFLELSLSRDWTWLWFLVHNKVICFVMEGVHSPETVHFKVILVHGKHVSHGFTVFVYVYQKVVIDLFRPFWTTESKSKAWQMSFCSSVLVWPV